MAGDWLTQGYLDRVLEDPDSSMGVENKANGVYWWNEGQKQKRGVRDGSSIPV